MSASPDPLLFQQTIRCHSVFSCFSPPCPVHCRLVATDSVATRPPLEVLRTSGPAPKLPISITLFRLRLTTPSQRKAGPWPKDAPPQTTRTLFCPSKIPPLSQRY